ncbi:MAG: hypothetical protein ACSHYB_15040 [Roseibacillus sp.]
MNALIQAADTLRKKLNGLSFPEPVTHTYNPLEYAWEPHTQYLEKYGSGPTRVLFMGMNPGCFSHFLPIPLKAFIFNA